MDQKALLSSGPRGAVAGAVVLRARQRDQNFTAHFSGACRRLEGPDHLGNRADYWGERSPASQKAERLHNTDGKGFRPNLLSMCVRRGSLRLLGAPDRRQGPSAATTPRRGGVMSPLEA
ncbi:hypothetical protein SKAU_G00346560 [Synaphobranchus kaupii]|uniref:Uncharacterized protein n=1 Tax=Synaphobranchus kaupii TaxID=118154 RepID=A0A9Q1EJR6_SYNKA|nr:hypothetical protein SKAU_G00346560 [Synaphobranchus kaupii]